MKKTLLVLAVTTALAMSTMSMAFANNGNGKGGGTASEVGKVNLCHFDEHVAPTDEGGAYLDDRNGTTDGFFTQPTNDYNHGDPVNLTGDYIVRYDDTGDELGLNSGQKGLCYGNGGEFIQVSVNSLDGHDPQLVFDEVLVTYPENWWK